VAVAAACACAALGASIGADAASSAQACGTVKVINGHTMRVSVVRGLVSCVTARRVIRYSRDVFTPGDLPPPAGDLPPAWTCSGARKGTITCTRGARTVRGRAIYY